MMHHAKRVPWVKIFDTGCLADSGRVQSWEQYGVKILEIFSGVPEKSAFCYFSDVIFCTCGVTFKSCL